MNPLKTSWTRRPGESTIADLERLVSRGEAQKAELEEQQRRLAADLEALARERARFDAERAAFQKAQFELDAANGRIDQLKAELSEAQATVVSVKKDSDGLTEQLRETHALGREALEATADIRRHVASLSDFDALARQNEQRMNALNAMSERVSHKAKSLEHQQQAVERASANAAKVRDLVSSMDAEIARLQAGMVQAEQADATLERLEKTAAETAERLEHGLARKSELEQELVRLERGAETLKEIERVREERRAIEQTEVEALAQRIAVLQDSATRLDGQTATLAERQQQVNHLGKSIGDFETRLEALGLRIRDLEEAKPRLDELARRFGSLEEQSTKASAHAQALEQNRLRLEVIRQEIGDLHSSFGAVSDLRDKLASDHSAMTASLERMDAFRHEMPRLEGRLEAIDGKLAHLERQEQRADQLISTVDQLERHTARVTRHQQVAERVEQRLGGLDQIARQVQQRLEEQLSRQADVEGLASLCDQVDLRVTDLQTRLEGITAAQRRLAPVTADVDRLTTEVSKIAMRCRDAQHDESTLVEQEERLSKLIAESRSLGAELGGRTIVLRALNDELSRAFEVKRELVDDLAQVRQRQDEVVAVLTQIEEQKLTLHHTLDDIKQRAEQSIFTEQRITTIAGRFGQLERLIEELDERILTVGRQSKVVEGVKQEVTAIHQIAGQAKKDLADVAAQHADVVALRHGVDALLGRIADVERQQVLLDTRKQQLDEVFRRTEGIDRIVDDVRIKLDIVSEQRALVDHAIQQLASLDSLIHEAKAAERSLQRERQLADRIKRTSQSREPPAASDDESLTA